MDYFIIKSSSKKEPNWSGKEFSHLPAKIYSCFEAVSDALSGYWFVEEPINEVDNRQVIIVPLTEKKLHELLEQKKVRW